MSVTSPLTTAAAGAVPASAPKQESRKQALYSSLSASQSKCSTPKKAARNLESEFTLANEHSCETDESALIVNDVSLRSEEKQEQQEDD